MGNNKCQLEHYIHSIALELLSVYNKAILKNYESGD